MPEWPRLSLPDRPESSTRSCRCGSKLAYFTYMERLEQWPHVSGARPLRGELTGSYRLRTGDYRVQFRVRGETVWIEQIGHRDGFYED